MRAALASTLEAIAAESLIQAIYASAIGFMRLAQHDYPAAGSAFTAAALFGSVGVAAAVAGRAIAPSQSGAGASAAGADRAIGAGSSGAQDGSNPQQGPHVTINLNGHVYGRSGIEEVCELINEYVGEADGYLLSSRRPSKGRCWCRAHDWRTGVSRILGHLYSLRLPGFAALRCRR